MWLTVTYNNGITEEFTLSFKCAQDLINRLIKFGNVTRIISGTKIIYNSNQEYCNRVESLEFYAQAVEDNRNGSGCCITDHLKDHSKAKKRFYEATQKDFKIMQQRALDLQREIMSNVINSDDRKELSFRCVLVRRTMSSYIHDINKKRITA